MKKDYFQRSIRIDGKLTRSPRFKTKRDLDDWLFTQNQKKRAKSNQYSNVVDAKTTLSIYFFSRWLPAREKAGYPLSTRSSDEQRFKDYVQKEIGYLVMSKITTVQIVNCLRKVVTEHGMSIPTRNKVRSLLSKVFGDAMVDEELPLCLTNPAMGITFNDPREGKSEPNYLTKKEDVTKYLSSAKKLGRNHFLVSIIGLMAGLRKQEIIPLKWGDIDFDECMIKVSRKYEQASNSIKEGTKAGKRVSREIPISDALVAFLETIRADSEYSDKDHFVVSKNENQNLSSRDVSRLNEAIREASGLNITVHGMRHTYGREFAKSSGDIKALQTILGHSNSSVTELYSKLAGRTVKKHRNTVSFDVDLDD